MRRSHSYPVLLSWALAVRPLGDRLPELAPADLLSVDLRPRAASVGLPVGSKLVLLTVAQMLRLGSLVSMERRAAGVSIMLRRATFTVTKVVLQPSATPPKTTSTTSYTNHGYGHVGWRHGYLGRYGAYDGDSYAQADGCYYVSAYRRYGYRRTLVCSSD
jgi:hypothetical protein